MNVAHQTHHNVTNFITYLPSNNSNLTDIRWKYNNLEIFNKFTQFNVNDLKEIKNEIIEEVTKEIAKEVIKDEINEIIIKDDVIEKKEEIIMKVEMVPCNKKIKTKTTDKNKKDELSPIEYIMAHCSASMIAKDYIKQKLIDTVSRKDYVKIFGLKKSSEIMSGLTKEKWNKPTALFISFLTDKEILYKGTSIVYNTDKKNE
jgi:hypothetical protein